jgi:hypothetical protein
LWERLPAAMTAARCRSHIFINSLDSLDTRPLEPLCKNFLDFKSSSKYDPCNFDAGNDFGLLGFPEISSGITRSGKGGQGESGGRQEIIRKLLGLAKTDFSIVKED